MALQMTAPRSRSRIRVPSGRVAYVGGRYLPHREAAVHIEDRGLQFADSVYEVLPILNGRLIDIDRHMERLERSLRELSMRMPMARAALTAVMRETVRRNKVKLGILYLQVTRGAHRRDHPIPDRVQEQLIMTARSLDPKGIVKRQNEGIAVITLPDNRWGRCDIKATGLLPAVMAKTKARQSGAYEAWYVDGQGRVTEGASTNAWIVTSENVLVTRELSNEILPGVTRAGVLHAMGQAGVNAIEERPFTPAEAHQAREAFITSSGAGIVPVVKIDGRPVGEGKAGPVTKRVQSLYRELWESEA